MKISETRSSPPLGRTRASGGVAASRPVASAAPTGAVAGARSLSDVAKFLGISEAELTPNVQRGLAQLLQEVDRLRKDNETKDQRIAHLETLADQDPLVPILNRRAFVREMSRMMTFSERYGGTSSVLFFDVNDMKTINDRHGHVAGDRALDHIARTLVGNIRPTDAVGRLGGDEFGVLLNQADDAAAQKKGADLRDLIQSQAFLHDGQHLHVSVAVGAFAFDGGQDIQEVLAAADQAMYVEKRRQTGVVPRSASVPLAAAGRGHDPAKGALPDPGGGAEVAARFPDAPPPRHAPAPGVADEAPSDGGLRDEVRPGRLDLGL